MTDAGTFIRNLNKHFPPEKQLPYFGQVIAWSDDGTTMLAHARTHDELFDELERRGIAEYVIDAMLADHAPANGTAPTVSNGTEASR